MRPKTKMRGKRADTDPTDGEVWLRLFETAIKAGKQAQEAMVIADQGGAGFRERFIRVVPVPLTGEGK